MLNTSKVVGRLSNEYLMDYATSRGHEILFAPLDENKALTIVDQGSHIILSSNLSRAEEKETVAHEIGHCVYGGFYNRYSHFDVRAKAEYRADKWAYHKIVPVRSVKAALEKGMLATWDLAEHFEVTCKYMQDVLDYYKSVGLL
jgi:hypothetical protein